MKVARLRKRYQVVVVPAVGERGLASRIAYSRETAEEVVSTARWGAFLNGGSGRRYRVRDRQRKEVFFEIDSAKSDHDELFCTLYKEYLDLRPAGLATSLLLRSETLHGEVPVEEPH